MMGKPQTPGAYVLNKVPVKHRLGHASTNQSDTSHLLNQTGGSSGEDCPVCLLRLPCLFKPLNMAQKFIIIKICNLFLNRAIIFDLGVLPQFS